MSKLDCDTSTAREDTDTETLISPVEESEIVLTGLVSIKFY